MPIEVIERAIDGATERSHSRGTSKRHQGQNQNVLHRALTAFVFVEASETPKREGIHAISPPKFVGTQRPLRVFLPLNLI